MTVTRFKLIQKFRDTFLYFAAKEIIESNEGHLRIDNACVVPHHHWLRFEYGSGCC